MEPLFTCKNTKCNLHEKAALNLSEYTQWPLLLTAVLFGAWACKNWYCYQGLAAGIDLVLALVLFGLYTFFYCRAVRRLRKLPDMTVTFYEDRFEVSAPGKHTCMRPYSLLESMGICGNAVVLNIAMREALFFECSPEDDVNAPELVARLSQFAPQAKIYRRRATKPRTRWITLGVLLVMLAGGLFAANALRNDMHNAYSEIYEQIQQDYPGEVDWKMETVFSGESFWLMRCYVEEDDSQLYLYTRNTLFGNTEVEHITVPINNTTVDMRDVEQNRYLLVFITTEDETEPLTLTDEYGNVGVNIPIRDGQEAVMFAKRTKGKYHYYANEQEFCTGLG